MTEEKAEIGARVAWCGAGINLATYTPATDDIKDAAMKVLNELSFSIKSKKIAAEYAALKTPNIITSLIEKLLAQPA